MLKLRLPTFKTLLEVTAEPFRKGQGSSWLLVLVYLLINGLVLLNVGLHDPRIGYDARGHLQYVSILAEWRLPQPEESREFFSPPLPYLVPAALSSLGVRSLYALKCAQLMNAVLSIGLTFILLKICLLLSERPSLRLGTLVALGILPVYYKTFCFVRGEPYVAFFVILSFFCVLQVFVKRQFSTLQVAALGVSLGLALLSRQWAAFVLPALFFFVGIDFLRNRCRQGLRSITGALLVAVMVAGWFYLLLYVHHGSLTAFNRKPAVSFDLNNQPPEFYTGLSLDKLFRNPIRPHFANQFLPTFYSEVWGDYWGFFVVYGFHQGSERYLPGQRVERILSTGATPAALETNFLTIGSYLGRVNLVSLAPSFLLVVGLLSAVFWRSERRTRARALEFSCWIILISAAGYFWFLIMYPSLGKGDTIKASYLLHVLPLIALHFGCFLETVERRNRLLCFLILLIFFGVGLHNSPAMLTRFSMLRLL